MHEPGFLKSRDVVEVARLTENKNVPTELEGIVRD